MRTRNRLSRGVLLRGKLLGLLLWLGLLSALAPLTAATTPIRADEPLEHFERRVRPLLIDRCYSCHSEETGKRKGGLLLDRREGWQIGGDSGPAVIPGSPDASLLIRAVRREGEELHMPPDESLTAAEVSILERWIRDGAPDPRDGEIVRGTVDLSEAREHWAFRPMATPVAPDPESSLDPIDQFVRRSLEAAGLVASPEADRVTLIRRLHFILTGLPPTAAEVEEFLLDRSPEAFDRVVDRLLDSPHFGERWGRHWLDLARYADSNGLDENLAYGNAWRYRDYVVRSWNEDRPYDRFLTEQLAGDLLPATGDERVDLDRFVATGFLGLGPKMLAEQDKEKLAIDIVDEQLDVAFQAFQGMTVGCARCHDHKFDPIPTKDYYAIAGIFRSTQTMQHFRHVSAWREEVIASDSQREARRGWEERNRHQDAAHEILETEITRTLEDHWRRHVDGALIASAAQRGRIVHLEAESADETNLRADDRQWGGPGVKVLHTQGAGPQHAAWTIRVPESGRYRLSVRYAALESRPMEWSLDDQTVAETALAGKTGGWLPPHQRWEDVAVLELDDRPHRLRATRDGAVPHLDRLRLVRVDEQGATDLAIVPGVDLPAEVIIGWSDFIARPDRVDDPFFAPWVELAAIDEAEFSARFSERSELLRARIGAKERGLSPLVSAVLDGFAPTSRRELATRYQSLLASVDPAGGGEKSNDREKKAPQPYSALALERALRGPDGPYAPALQVREQLCPPKLSSRLEISRRQQEALKKSEPQRLPRTMAVAEGDPMDLPVHVRGSHLQLASRPTPRGALSITNHLVPRLEIGEGASGRLELARWMLHPEHPLTARVAVNRIWQGLFGDGLVRSPSNFGLRGDTPSHPELLDRLARDFIADGWSRKRLIRRILRTETWRRGSDHDPVAAERDPENRWLWRQNRRRLEAELVRDALFAVSGRLDPTLGGTLLPTPNRGYVTNDQSRNQARYDAPRRALYLPVIRNAMYELFSAFDYNDPSVPVDRRHSTVVAHQALFFLNSPLAIESAKALATRGAKDDTPDVERIGRLYRELFGRPPTRSEAELATQFLDRAETLLASTPVPAALSRDVPPMGTPEPAAAAAAAGTETETETEKDAVDPDPAIPPSPRSRAWHALTQALLASSEFITID